MSSKSAEEALKHAYRLVNVLVVHIEVSYGSYPLAHGANQDPLIFQAGLKLGCGGVAGFEKDEVRVDLFDLEARQILKTAYQSLGATMIVGQAVSMILEGVTATGRHHAGLAESAAEHVFISSGSLDKIFAATKNRTQRGSQAFGKVDPDGIAKGGVGLSRDPRGNNRVEQARTIHMDFQAMSKTHVSDATKFFHRPHSTTGKIVSLLDADQGRYGGVGIGFKKSLFQSLSRKSSVATGDNV